MKLLQWTLFIDMLGYRDINGAINTEASAMDFIKFMEMNKFIFDYQNNQHITGSYEKNNQFDLYKYYNIKHAFISDSLVLTFYPLEVESLTNPDEMYMHSANALFIITMRLQSFIFNCFSAKGVFLRGGVSNKYCYIKGSFAVGEGLIEAYKIESMIAKYPRIAFSMEVISNCELMKKITFLSNEMYNGSQLISIDPKDNVHFIDYLGFHLATIDINNGNIKRIAEKNHAWFSSHLKTVENFVKHHSSGIEGKLKELKLKRETLPDSEMNSINGVIDKFEWLKSYHNNKVYNSPLVSKLIVN